MHNVKRRLLLGFAILTLSACRIIQPTTKLAAPATAPALAVATPAMLQPTLAPITTGAIADTVTNTVAGWGVVDRHDSTIPNVITPQVQGYAVDPNWEVAEIDYTYHWWGLGTPVFDVQHLTLQGDTYIGLTRTVALTEVQILVASLNHLHPVSMLVGGQSHSDDYPSWHIRLAGTNGHEVNLSSTSTVLPGGVPWNVYSNGQIFAQYNGALTQPLFQLFKSPFGEPSATVFFPDGGNPNRMPFNSEGLPPEFTIGFSGLTAIREGFQYQTDPISQTLNGTIIGRQSIGGFGNMIIGTITDVLQVQIEPVAGIWLDCPLTPVSTQDMAGAQWDFLAMSHRP